MQALDNTTRKNNLDKNNLEKYILDPKTPGGQSLREFSKSEFNDENFTFIDSINILESLKSNSLDPSPDLNVKTALETIAAQLNQDRASFSKKDKTAIKEVNISAAVRQELGPNITDYIIAVAKLFDDPRVYQPAKVRPEILDLAEALSGAKEEITKLIKTHIAPRWYSATVIDEETKKPISNMEYFMDKADEWVKSVSFDPPTPTGRNRSGAIDEGRVPLPEPIPIPSEGIPIAQEGSPEITSTPELTPMPETSGERNEGGGE